MRYVEVSLPGYWDPIKDHRSSLTLVISYVVSMRLAERVTSRSSCLDIHCMTKKQLRSNWESRLACARKTVGN